MKIVMLCGGVGGARGALALYENLPPQDLTFLVNTGDDFTHLGLEIWPDWDTVVYHLAGLNDPVRGWGRAGEGSAVMEELERLEAPSWFHLGDRDVALHLYRHWARRTNRSRAGIAAHVCRCWNVGSRVLPLTEEGMGTRLLLQDGTSLDFQEWFVKERCIPRVSGVTSSPTALTEGVEAALREADLLLMAPSNPYLSLGPMLSHPELAAMIKSATVPKLAVSPLIGGRAVKGPLDQLIASLSPHSGQEAMAHYWKDWVDALLLPPGEGGLERSPLPLLPAPTRLGDGESRKRFCRRLVEIVETF